MIAEIKQLLDSGCMEWDHLELISSRIKPGEKLLELGSGISTRYWNECGIDCTSYEHNPIWAKQTGAELRRIRDGWYRIDGQIECDVLVVDGPNGSTGERYNLPIEMLDKNIRIIFVDDCQREKDLKMAKRIAEYMGRPIQLHIGKEKTLAEI